MAMCVNPDSEYFRECLNSEIYVDKTELIAFTNRKINTQQKYICVSRPRRFGKSMAANMLATYYGCGENTKELFTHLNIASNSTFTKHLNKYCVVKVDMQSFMTVAFFVPQMISVLSKKILKELANEFPEELTDEFLDIKCLSEDGLWGIFDRVYSRTKRKFVILIDEWDCVMRRYYSENEKKIYLDFLRNWLKDKSYIALAYMTGILPIKKYGEHSTLNMFDEYSMIRSFQLVPFFGFTEEEVRELCERYNMDFKEAKEWYDGYKFVKEARGNSTTYSEIYSIYSPKSVVDAMLNEYFDSYWTQTETYEALKEFIQKDYDGLKTAIIEMLAGNPVAVNTRHFQNDMSTFHGRDDVLTLLIHLGYLSYHSKEKTVSIPNKEVAEEFVATIENIESYSEVFHLIQQSRNLLEALWREDEDVVAQGIEKAHQHFPAIKYNNENALSCVIELAFYYAQEYYTVIRELPTGKGFADICFLPKPNYNDKPAVIIELKWDKTADTAINQIKRKDYPDKLKAYKNNLLLCGINYDKNSEAKNKRHQCKIERIMQDKQ